MAPFRNRTSRLRGLALLVVAAALSAAGAAPAQAAAGDTLAHGETVRAGVSSVTWAIGILDPHVNLHALPASGRPDSRAGGTAVLATQHPKPLSGLKPASGVAKKTLAAPTSGGALPPASAGTNGTRVKHSSVHWGLHTRAALGAQINGPTTTLLGGLALAPPSAPAAIQAAVDAANNISKTPYIWGGGHASFNAPGYDCSGAVSYALHAAGFLSQPLASGQLMNWGAPGPGKWLTVYASPTHAYAVIAGLRWDTVGDARGTGPRWHPEGPYPAGFVVRHFPGY